MSLAASLTVVPASVFKQHKGTLADLEVPPGAACFRLDKAWLPLHIGLRGMRKPLCIAIEGDYPVYGRVEGGLIRTKSEVEAKGEDDSQDEEDEDDMDDEEDDDFDFYLGYASPTLVKKLDQALNLFTQEKLFAAIKEEGWPSKKSDQESYSSSFSELKKAYRTAATAGAAVQILIT